MSTEAILKNYDLGTVRGIESLSHGLINQTSLVHASVGDFILQRLHPIYAPGATANIAAVTEHLAAKKMLTMRIVPTRQKEFVVTDDEQRLWRLVTCIPGKIITTVPSARVAFSAAVLLGQFHRNLSDAVITFAPTRATETANSYFDDFVKATEGSALTEEMLRWRKEILTQLPLLRLPEALRHTITHGDTKITNIIFADDDTAKAMIDLDDVGDQENILADLGQAVRSWCSGNEDNPNNQFNIDYFAALVDGYQSGSKNFATHDEMRLLPQAARFITLELAARFLSDYFEDSYFAFDASRYASRREHNLARARGQMALYYDLCSKEAQMNAIVARY